MSSDFYSSSLSRNLVRTGGAGYRENASLHLLLGATESPTGRSEYLGQPTGFSAFPDFRLYADKARKTVSTGRIRLGKPILSFGEHPLAGPLLT